MRRTKLKMCREARSRMGNIISQANPHSADLLLEFRVQENARRFYFRVDEVDRNAINKQRLPQQADFQTIFLQVSKQKPPPPKSAVRSVLLLVPVDLHQESRTTDQNSCVTSSSCKQWFTSCERSYTVRKFTKRLYRYFRRGGRVFGKLVTLSTTLWLALKNGFIIKYKIESGKNLRFKMEFVLSVRFLIFDGLGLKTIAKKRQHACFSTFFKKNTFF